MSGTLNTLKEEYRRRERVSTLKVRDSFKVLCRGFRFSGRGTDCQLFITIIIIIIIIAAVVDLDGTELLL